MKIAIIGTRGVPARYGGFETIAETLSTGLAKKKNDVFVYCRNDNDKNQLKKYKGVNLLYIPYINNKYLGTISHALFSLLLSVFKKYDIYIIFNVGLVPICVLIKLLNKKVILNVNGFEWYRKKWNYLSKLYFITCAFFARFFSDRIITDSRNVQKYYQEKLLTKTDYITNGAQITKSADIRLLKKFKVEAFNYFFTASRLVPENNIDLLIKAFKKLNTRKILIIAGGSRYSEAYAKRLFKLKNNRIFFLGPLYNPDQLAALHYYCYSYFHGNDSGGTSLALLKALSFGNCVLTINTKSNLEVADDSAIIFNKNVSSLYQKMRFILNNRDKVQEYKTKAVKRIRKYYSWNIMINKNYKLIKNILYKK